MLQVNIALGILYWALREARYRRRLFNSIVGSFKSRPMKDWGPVGREALGELLIGDSEFAASFHRVSSWRRALPGSYDDELEDTAARMFPRASPPTDSSEMRRSSWRALEKWRGELPITYRWFRSDRDKHTVFAVTTIVPIILLWRIVWHPEVESLWSYAYIFLGAGQAWVAFNVWLGRHMVKVHGSEFHEELEHVVVEFEEAAGQMEAAKDPRSP